MNLLIKQDRNSNKNKKMKYYAMIQIYCMGIRNIQKNQLTINQLEFISLIFQQENKIINQNVIKKVKEV